MFIACMSDNECDTNSFSCRTGKTVVLNEQVKDVILVIFHSLSNIF